VPGNLEALPILPERAYVVKQKARENPYPTTVSARTGARMGNFPHDPTTTA